MGKTLNPKVFDVKIVKHIDGVEHESVDGLNWTKTKGAIISNKQPTLARSFWIGFQKCFRGLVAEQKNSDGSWELSLQRVAFWSVLGHCLIVWNKVDTLATAAVTKLDVSEGELYTLWALLGYGGVKVGAEATKSLMATWKGGA